MPKLSQIEASTSQSVLLFGPPKSGKTEMAGRLSTDFNIIYVGLENGHQTLLKFPKEMQEKIDVILLPDTRSFPIGIETCLKLVKGNEWFIHHQTGKAQPASVAKLKPAEYSRYCFNELGPDTIVIWDSLTQLTNSAISHITKNQPDDYKLQFDDWGHLGKLLDIFLSHIQQAPYHTICISHETEAELEDGKMRIVPVAGSRNFSRNSAKYFGHVVYCEVKNKKHVFTSSTTGTMNVMTGSRTNVETEKMAEPSLLPIFQVQQAKTPGELAATKNAALAGK